MPIHLGKLVALASIGVLVAGAATAGPLNPQWVGADAQWMAHVDVAAMLKTGLVKHVLDNPERFDIQMDGVEEIKQHIGLDPLTDIRGFTAYGAGNPHEGNFVFVFTVAPVIDQSMERIKAGAPEYREITTDGYTVHSFKEEHGPLYFNIREASPGGGPTGDRVVVMSHDLDRLIDGLEVIDGKAASLATARDGAATHPSPSSGSVAFIAANTLDWLGDMHEADEDDHASALLRSAEQITLDIGESGEDTFINGTLAVGSTEDATNVADMLRGLMALGKMATKSEPELAGFGNLFNGVTLGSSGSRVQVSIRQPTQMLIQALEQAAALDDDDTDDDADDDDEDREVEVEVKTKIKHSAADHEH